jgi:hypothetical protein
MYRVSMKAKHDDRYQVDGNDAFDTAAAGLHVEHHVSACS